MPFLCKRLGKRLINIHVLHEVIFVKDAVKILSGTDDLEVLSTQIREILGEND